jgi:hypothetical protein
VPINGRPPSMASPSDCASRRVNREERDRTLDNVGHGMDGAALEEQQMARREFSAISRVVYPKRTPAGEHVEVLVAAAW